MDHRSELWGWVRWLGLMLLLFSGMSRYELQAAWGAGSELWSGTVGTSGIAAEWSKDLHVLPVSSQGLHLESWLRGGYEMGGGWGTWVWSSTRRKVGAGIPSLIVAYLVAWSMGHYACQFRKRQLLKTSTAPPP